jgi:hypothetical protein
VPLHRFLKLLFFFYTISGNAVVSADPQGKLRPHSRPPPMAKGRAATGH